MARRKFNNEKGERGSYAAFYHCVLESQAIKKLSAHAVKLLVDLMVQYKGNNNGDLCATFSAMQKRNWHSKGTLNRAIKELLEAGLIEISRQGGRHQCSLFAITFYAVDECNGKLDITSTVTPKSLWREHEPLPNIANLQKQKQQKDDAMLTKMILDRCKRVAIN